MGGAIRRMLNNKLSMAWEQVAAEMKRQAFMMSGVIGCLLQGFKGMEWFVAC